MPGVRGVTMSRQALMTGSRTTSNITVPGYTGQPGENMDVYVNLVGDRFLTVMGMPLVLGRDLESLDGEMAPRVAVINQTLARRYFEGNPLGREFAFGSRLEKPIRIVGVAADAKYESVRSEAPPTVYLTYRQVPLLQSMTFELRTSGEPLSLVPAVRKAVAEIDPMLPLAQVRTQEYQVAEAMRRERTFAVLASFFSTIALALAAIGLYGALAYAVTRRTSEFGIRMALGATGAQVRLLAVRGALAVVAAGILIGIPSALALARLVKSRLYSVEPADSASIVLAAASMLLAGVLAAWIPGRRASKSDPAIALRCE